MLNVNLFMHSSYRCLVAVVEYYFPHNYFDASLIGAQADQYVLKEILQCRLPRLHAHLDDVGVEMCSFTLNWFLAIYFEVVPFNVSEWCSVHTWVVFFICNTILSVYSEA